jgi:hypothetical protein
MPRSVYEVLREGILETYGYFLQIQNALCDGLKVSRSDGYRPLKLSSGCDCIVEEDGESSRHDHSLE